MWLIVKCSDNTVHYDIISELLFLRIKLIEEEPEP
jgi:hypothetical protein